MQIFGYKCFQTCRKKLKFGRKHGGLAVYVHNALLSGISKVPLPGSETIILKLKKEYFKFSKDIMLSFSYCAPAGSSFLTRTQFDPFTDLEQKLTNVANDGDLICFGDYNARTGTKLDYLENEDNRDIPIPEDYLTDTVATYPRGNLDTVTNQYGDQLISLCRSVPLRICNGRKLGDILGSYTCYKWNGKSTVDYCLASPGAYTKIGSFQVNEFLPTLSDHCPISISLETDIHCNFQIVHNYNFVEKPRKIKWNKKIQNSFENVIQSSDSKTFLSNFVTNGIASDQNSIDTATQFLTDFLVNSAKMADDTLKVEYKGSKKNSQPNWKFRKKVKNKTQPKWHDDSCESLKKKIRHTSSLLKTYPNNSYLRGCLQSEHKKYKKLVKSKHKEYINKLFTDLDELHSSDPRGYMNLVKSLRDGSFDKKISDSSSFVSPDKWREHFSELLGPPVTHGLTENTMTSFVTENVDQFMSELDNPITRTEIIQEISGLDNNKATSFDMVSNEILKAGKLVIATPVLRLFNAILRSTLYPSNWKLDILSPLHKSGEKSDPNNFRGIAVSSCFGKLFNKILQRRLEKFCKSEKSISDLQGSGKAGSRTSDHLLIVRCLFDKYVKLQGRHLYTCFVDLRKAFDTVPRAKLFFTLLKDYSIGGNFLKIIQQIYTENQIFVKLSDGLLQPFYTTVGVKQGCVFSPILFNLFINKICGIFDKSCDPVQLNNDDINCLLWADDLLLVSKSPTGLQHSIDKMQTFYDSLGLEVNIKKTKIMVMNKSGRKLDKSFEFKLNGVALEITDQYQYLGLKLRPSGSMNLAVQELNDKASRAWYSISNIVFKNKRMEIDKIFGIFDSLVTPVATYGSPFWLPLIIPKKSFENQSKLFEYWETFKCEILNQKCARMALSVNKKTSRLAVLGELARYPLFLKSLSYCLNYRLSLFNRRSSNNLIDNVIKEMESMANLGHDSWLTRVGKIEKALKIPQNIFFNKSSGKRILSLLKGKFDRYFLDQINHIKIVGTDTRDHNKLSTYKTLKGSFTREPYLTLVRNRNQRSFLSRIRVGSHNLRIELGRHTRPVTPVEQRTCQFCSSESPPCHPASNRTSCPSPPTDTEFHFLMECPMFSAERTCFLGKIQSLNPNFATLNLAEKFQTILCPTTAKTAKLVNRFIKTMFEGRKKSEMGEINSTDPPLALGISET